MQRLMDDYISNGKVKPRELFVTHRIALDQIDKVYYSMREHNEKDKIIKVRPLPLSPLVLFVGLG